MKNVIARGAGVVAIGVSAASMAMLGVGTAHADSLSGQKYSDAKSIVNDKMGATPVLSTVNGDVLDLDDCIVASWSKSSAVSALGESDGTKVLLNLNCYAQVAEAGVPGNSAMTPTGKRAKKWNSWAEKIAADPTRFGCYTSDQQLEDCKEVCDSTGKCDAGSL